MAESEVTISIVRYRGVNSQISISMGVALLHNKHDEPRALATKQKNIIVSHYYSLMMKVKLRLRLP